MKQYNPFDQLIDYAYILKVGIAYQALNDYDVTKNDNIDELPDFKGEHNRYMMHTKTSVLTAREFIETYKDKDWFKEAQELYSALKNKGRGMSKKKRLDRLTKI